MDTFQPSEIVSNGDFSPETRDTLSVLWALTRACNFNCEYCLYSRDHKLADEVFCSKEELLGAAQKLLDLNRPGYQITLYGGEPTFHPHFLDLLSFLGESKAPISLRVFTNASRSPRFFEKMFTLTKDLPFGMIFSLHLEHAKFDNFIKSLELAIDAGVTAGVSLMVQAKWRDRAHDYAERLLSLRQRKPFFMNIVVPYSSDGVVGEDCTAEDNAWIVQTRSTFDQIPLPPHFKSPFFTRIHSNITIERDGERIALPPEASLQLLSKSETPCYGNFYCCGGTNVMFVASDGTVSGSVCEISKSIFNLIRDPLPEIVSKMCIVHCTAKGCNSIENIPLPKFRHRGEAEACVAAFRERAIAHSMSKPAVL